MIANSAVNGLRSSSNARREGDVMIDRVRNGGSSRIELNRSAPGAAARPAASAGRIGEGSGVAAGSAVSDLVSLGAPVDSDKVAAIRAAIAEGRYPVDPRKIAERMVDMDLPL